MLYKPIPPMGFCASEQCETGIKVDGIAVGSLVAAVAPTTAAQCQLLVTAANLDLLAIGDDVALTVDAGIDDGLAAT